MEIIKATDLGFCFGVRRAVEMMEQAAGQLGQMQSLGSTVHNRQVVDRLHERGVEVIQTTESVDSLPVAITAHGVGPQVLEELDARGVQVVDTTCPIVTRSQQWAKRLVEEGYGVIIFGDPNHKEVRGVLGWAKGKVLAVPDEAGITELPDWMPSRIGVLAQTTETEERFASFVRHLLATHLARISDIRVINTLCNATTSQQAAAEALARTADVVVVVGGRESANTRHLAEVSREAGATTYQIETAEEIQAAWLENCDRVGVTAGTSTPDYVIDAVVARLRELAPA